VDLSGHGPAVVLLHGQPGSRRDWQAVAAGLAPTHTVVVPDRPGWGDSPDAAGGFAVNADIVVAQLDELGLDAATIVGHSWGAGVALAVAQQHPARVAGLVLVAPVVPGDRIGPMDRTLASPRLGAVLSFAALGALAFVPRLPGAGRLLTVIEPGLDVAPARSSAATVAPLRSWRSFAVEQRALVDELPGLAGGLADLAVPVTVVMGTADRVIRPQAVARLMRALPGAEVVEVRAGHALPLASPDVIVEAVTATVARARPR